MSGHSRRIGRAIVALVAFSLLDVGGAYAQEAIQEVLVTAQKREENVQAIPIAISALSSEELQKRGVTDFTGIATSSTSINFTPYPSSSTFLILYMRGLGVADANQITQDGSVGLYEDGFYISRPQLSTFDLADVERVEVLRGPQGTLYGRNTTGGAVNIISQKPTGELDFKGQLTYGSRSNTRALATLNLPKTGPLSLKLTLVGSHLDGYVTNPGPTEDFGLQRQRAGRLSAHFDGGSNFNADYFYEHGNIDSTAIYYQDPALNGKVPGYNGSGQPNSTAWRAFNNPLSTGTNEAQGLTLTWNINDSTTLKSLTGYRTLYTNWYQTYGDAFSDPTTAAFIGYVDVNSRDTINSHSASQEFQLIGDLGKQFNYVFGLYYFRENANHLENGATLIPGLPYACAFSPPSAPPCSAPIPFSLTFNQQTARYVAASAKSQAAYFQGTWKPAGFDDKLALTVGLRYTKDNRDATRTESITFVPINVPAFPTETGGTNTQSFNKFNPAGTIDYSWTPDVSTYFRVATGYKAGGSSEAGTPGTFALTYGPEKLTQYELGLKSYWFGRRLRVNAAAFHSDVKDLQLSFNTNPSQLAFVLTQNAGSATIDGLELETLFQPINDLTLGINYTYLDARIKTVIGLPGTFIDPAVNPAILTSPYRLGQDVSALFRMPYAPKNIFNINADWAFFHEGGNSLALQLNYRYQDRQYDTAPTGPAVPNAQFFYSIPGHGLLDARLTWNSDLANKKRARISVWANNVGNIKYLQHIIGQGPFVPLTTSTGGVQPAGYYYSALAWAPKGLYGVDFSYGF